MLRTLGLTLMIFASATSASAVTLIDCWDGSHGGDVYDRGFYIPDYPGSTLDQVDLRMNAEIADTYTIRLTARADTYDGALIGMDEVTIPLPVFAEDPVEVNFTFGAAIVTQGSVVTFAIEVVDDFVVYYHIVPSNPTCPVIQTHGTTPPLDEVRRNGLRIRVHGNEATANTPTTWSALKGSYR